VLKEGWASKAWRASPDGVILDLEDSIPLDLKKEARESSREISSEPNLNWFIRINSYASGLWKEDLRIALNDNVVGILIPKVESSLQIREIASFTSRLEAKVDRKSPKTIFIPVIESSKGAIKMVEIAGANRRILTLAFGAADFSNDMGFLSPPIKSAINSLKFQIAMVAKASGLKPPHDSPYFNINDEKGLVEETHEAKSLAYGGKHAIHPSQVKTIKNIFKVDNDELREAQKVVGGFEEAIKRGVASIQVNGKMVDYPIYYRAKRLLEGAMKNE
jgi:citrate lyase subunit beta/citryl-CoA lyase